MTIWLPIVLIGWLGHVTCDSDWRLPQLATPVHYQVTLLPVLEDGGQLCGHVWIDIVVRKRSNFVIVSAADIEVLEATFEPWNDQEHVMEPRTDRVEELCFSGVYGADDASANRTVLDNVHVSVDLEQVTLFTPHGLMAVGDRYRIGLLFRAKIYDETAQAFHRMSYTDDTDCCKKWMAATQLEATFARRVFPCYDEPHLKSSFDVVVGHRHTLTALSNMPVESTSSMKNTEGWVWSRFHRTPDMSTYLVAVALTYFDHVEYGYYGDGDSDPVLLRFWFSPDNFGMTDFAYDLAPKVLSFLERYLEESYQLPKVDFISLPGLQVMAMENWGLIIHSDASLLYDQDRSDNMERARVSITVTHELAHQWFGNLITSPWWDDVWLNEGLCSLFENIVLNELLPGPEWDLIQTSATIDALATDQLSSSKAIGLEITQPEHVAERFNTLIYNKGSAIMKMLRRVVGEDVFRSALVAYFDQLKYRSANSSQLLELVNQKAHESHVIHPKLDMTAVMYPWIHHKGFPLIRCMKLPSGRIYLSQKPFFDVKQMATNSSALKNQKCPPATPLWWVPVELTAPRENGHLVTTAIAWLSPRKPYAEINNPAAEGSWYLANYYTTGFYRVNYDLDNWELIARQLLENHTAIPAPARARLLDDAFNLAHGNIIPYETAFRLSEYLTTGVDSTIREIVRYHWKYMESIGILAVVEPAKVTEYFEETSGERSLTLMGRTKLKPEDYLVREKCEAGEVICKRESLRLYRSLMNITLTSSDYRILKENTATIWCTAIRFGGADEWQFAWRKSLGLGPWPDRKTILTSLACSRNAERIKKLLARVYHPDVKQSAKDSHALIEALTANPQARTLVTEFLLANWPRNYQQFGRIGCMKLLKAATRYANSDEDLRRMERWLAKQTHNVVVEDFRPIVDVIRENMSLSRRLTDPNVANSI